MNHFGIVGFQRTGTTALLRALCQIDCIDGFPWEVSLPGIMIENGLSYPKVPIPEADQLALSSKLIEGLESHSCLPNTRFWGWKTAVGNTDGMESSISRLSKLYPDTKIIFCERRDLVAQIGSAQLASSRGYWQAWEKSEVRTSGTREKEEKVKIDPGYLFWMLNEGEKLRMILDNCQLEVLRVTLEEDFCDLRNLVKKICGFLGLQISERHVLDIPNEGKVSPPPRDYIENYETSSELLNKLRGSKDRNETFRRSISISYRIRRLLHRITHDLSKL